MKYLAYVDGLRAISILSVVLYHIGGIPGFSGGFVGVDVFFVISGYLIIGQIANDLTKDRFSFSEFWSRRALRILPPYLLVIIASMIAAQYVLVTEKEFTEFGDQALYSALMVVNHYFLEQQGYWDTGAELKPLLHLWSLAVEEQFYVVAPILLFLGWRFRRYALPLVAILFIASLAGSVMYTNVDDKNYAFYLMPLRAWEFIAGGAALLITRGNMMPKFMRDPLGVVGLVAILLAVSTFSEDTAFPSYSAMLPVFGAVAIIASGSDSLVGRLLSTRPMVGIGLVSYSWYLWHWPLLSFGRIYNFEEQIFAFDLAMGIAALVLAIGTFFLVERPIRDWRRRQGALGWRPAYVGGAVAALIAVAGATVGYGALPNAAIAAAQERPKPATVERPVTRGYIFGDSHARTAYAGLSQYLAERKSKLIVATGSGCPPFTWVVIRTPTGGSFKKCTNIVSKKLGDAKADYAILHARWNIYGPQPEIMLGGKTMQRLLDREGVDPADQDASFVSSLKTTIRWLRKKGVKRILIIGPTPEFVRRIPECIARADQYGKDRDAYCSVPRATNDSRRAKIVGLLKQGADGMEGVRVVDPINMFCGDDICRPYHGDDLLFRDANHLSESEGVPLMVASMKDDLDWLVGR
jgi:peptidoglycan/LPS O-acetylase OafA/YrhL